MIDKEDKTKHNVGVVFHRVTIFSHIKWLFKSLANENGNNYLVFAIILCSGDANFEDGK